MLPRVFLTAKFILILSVALAAQITPAKKSVNSFSERFLSAQIALTEQGFSSGSVDGMNGNQTQLAIKAFQTRENLTPSGELNDETFAKLGAQIAPPLKKYSISAEDLSSLQPLPKTWLEKSQVKNLGYETALELVAEKHLAHPRLLQRLNPKIDWNKISAGTVVEVPDVRLKSFSEKAGLLSISLKLKTLQVYSAERRLLAHFPCSIAARVEKRPVGKLKVINFAANPVYTFDPANFPESEEARKLTTKLILPPGANNPVGLAWIGLDLPGYGIHGAPAPEQIGRTESHGCFRLTNWDALQLLKLVKIGTVVSVEN